MKITLRKIITFSLIVLSLGFTTVGSTFANDDEKDSSYYTKDSSCEYFLGMPAWNCNLNTEGIDSTEDLKGGIWLIVANVSISASVLAAYLALGFVLYGGYRYIFSGGDPGKVTSGKKTLTTAFIGLGIVLLANVIFNGIKFALLQGNAEGSELYGLPKVEANIVFTNAVGWVLGVAGFAAAAFLVYGGISYITSSGDAGKLTKAKNTIIYALIGLAIVGLSELILAFVSSQIRKSAESARIDNQIIALVKEENEK